VLYYFVLCLKILFEWVFKIKVVFDFYPTRCTTVYNPTQNFLTQLKNTKKKNKKIKIKIHWWSRHHWASRGGGRTTPRLFGGGLATPKINGGWPDRFSEVAATPIWFEGGSTTPKRAVGIVLFFKIFFKKKSVF
jgi:hypothetical protein